MSTHQPTQRAQSFRRIAESCADPVTGWAVGEEDYSHGNRITKVTPQRKAHTQKETGYLDGGKLLVLETRLREGEVVLHLKYLEYVARQERGT